MTLKMLPASWYLKYLFKGFRSFNTVNMGPVGQRALKLIAVKVGGLKKKSAIWPRPLSNQSALVWLRPGSNLTQSLTDSNFAALWSTDPISTVLKYLNLLSKCVESPRGWQYLKGGLCPLKVTSFSKGLSSSRM